MESFTEIAAGGLAIWMILMCVLSGIATGSLIKKDMSPEDWGRAAPSFGISGIFTLLLLQMLQ
jgi:hypothetical protein